MRLSLRVEVSLSGMGKCKTCSASFGDVTKGGAKAVYLKGTCHKCSRNLREGTAVGACDSCGAR